MARIWVTAGIAFALLATSCSDDTERNIILDTTPFFRQDVRYETGGDGKIIASVRRFAETHEMDFLLARDSLPPGDFNVTAASHQLNLNVIHTSPIDQPWHATIYATARGKPTEADQARLREFLVAIRTSATSSQS